MYALHASPPVEIACHCFLLQDPKVVLRRKQELTQSKLRMASSATDPPSPLLDPVTDPPAVANNGGLDVQVLTGDQEDTVPCMLCVLCMLCVQQSKKTSIIVLI
jgi:hypothetical protein